MFSVISNHKELKEARARIAELEEQVKECNYIANQRNTRIDLLNHDNARLTDKLKGYDKLLHENATLKSKLRDRCKGEILINALKIIGVIENDDPGMDRKANHDHLAQQLAGLANSNARGSMGYNLKNTLFTPTTQYPF